MTRQINGRLGKTGHRIFRVWLIATLAISAVAAPTARADKLDIADLEALQDAFTKFSEDVKPSVVAIRTYYLRKGSKKKNASVFRESAPNQGSGFIISSDGFVVTNNHVIRGVDQYVVVLHDGREFVAKLMGTDTRADLAVLKIDEQHLKAVKLGDLKNVKVGQWAIAVGNPFGLASMTGGSSVTVGNVSALGRDMTRWLSRNPESYYGNLIETSAAINPGNSGGPLFDLHGQVIGIITAIETRSGVNEGLGYAIPIDQFTRRVIDTLKTGKAVRYGFLGLHPRDPNPHELRSMGITGSGHGVVVSRVEPGLPADVAGLKDGDLITQYNGEAVRDSDHLIRMVGATPVGAKVSIKYLRKGQEFTTTVTIADRRQLNRSY